MTEAASSHVMAARDGSVVQVEGVNHFFGQGEARNQVLFDNALSIGAGQLVIMTGPSGSGKTTLLTLIGALRQVQDGTLAVLGRRLSGLSQRDLVRARRNIGFIFQLHNLFDSLSAYENVKMAMQLGDHPLSEMRDRGVAILSRLGLGHRVDYMPRALSGGQCQRVAIARALVNRPRLILADEPTASLDKDSTMKVLRLFQDLVEQDGCTIIMVTHDNRVLHAADRVVNMVDGRIVSDVLVKEGAMLCEFLAGVTGFEKLAPTALAGVAERMRPRAVRAGEDIVTEGEPGLELFVIREGEVDVLVGRGEDQRKVAALGRGSFFGERALITGEPRSATVRAASDGLVYALDKASFEAALNASPTLKDQIFSVYFQRQ